MNYCPNCGIHLDNNNAYCSNCGTRLNGTNAYYPERGTTVVESGIVLKKKTEQQKNKAIKFLLIGLGVNVLSILGAFARGGFGATMARVALFYSPVFVLIASIMCIRQSKNCKNHRGRALGITFTILNSITVLVIAIILIASFNPAKERLAVDCAEKLASMVKDPASLTIRGDILVIDSEDRTAQYVAIRFSANNSYGGKVDDVAFFSDIYGYLGNPGADIEDMSEWKRSQFADIQLYYGIGEIIPWGSEHTVSGRRVARAIGCDYSRY